VLAEASRPATSRPINYMAWLNDNQNLLSHKR
jgi:hypothetical protein